MAKPRTDSPWNGSVINPMLPRGRPCRATSTGDLRIAPQSPQSFVLLTATLCASHSPPRQPAICSEVPNCRCHAIRKVDARARHDYGRQKRDFSRHVTSVREPAIVRFNPNHACCCRNNKHARQNAGQARYLPPTDPQRPHARNPPPSQSTTKGISSTRFGPKPASPP